MDPKFTKYWQGAEERTAELIAEFKRGKVIEMGPSVDDYEPEFFEEDEPVAAAPLVPPCPICGFGDWPEGGMHAARSIA